MRWLKISSGVGTTATVLIIVGSRSGRHAYCCCCGGSEEAKKNSSNVNDVVDGTPVDESTAEHTEVTF